MGSDVRSCFVRSFTVFILNTYMMRFFSDKPSFATSLSDNEANAAAYRKFNDVYFECEALYNLGHSLRQSGKFIESIEVFNPQGESIVIKTPKAQNAELHLDQFAAGVYIVRISNGEQFARKRIVLQ